MERPDSMENIMKKVTLTSPSDGLEISVLTCTPQKGARGIVQLVHGMCEHEERYIPFMEFLAEEGYASIIHDHRGPRISAISMKAATWHSSMTSRQ